jgi:hypothetical protein
MNKKQRKHLAATKQAVKPSSQAAQHQASTQNQPSDQPRKKISGWVIAALVSVASALGVAALDQTKEVFKEQIKPVFTNASCSVAEVFRSNAAKNRFTVVVLPFANDPKNTAQSSISEALANKYGFNVISSCSTIEIPTSGNREDNLDQARKRASSLIDKYDADMLLFGALDLDKSGNATNNSRIIDTSREYIQYLYASGVKYSDRFDGSKPDSYVSRLEFVDTLVEYAEQIGESSGCFNDLLAICDNKTRGLSSARLAEKLQRIRHIQNLYVNGHYWESYLHPKETTQISFLNLGRYAAAIATELYSNRGMKELRSSEADKPPSLLDIAENSLRTSDVYSDRPHLTDDSYNNPWTAIQTGQIHLLRGEACSSDFELESARQAFDYARPKLTDTLDSNGNNKLHLALFLLASARTKLGLYALTTQQNANDLRADFEREAREALESISKHRQFLSEGAYYGKDNNQMIQEAEKKIDGEMSLIQTGLSEKDQARLRSLLGMRSCQ